MTAQQQTKLARIKAQCERIVELGERATAGPWRADFPGEAIRIRQPNGAGLANVTYVHLGGRRKPAEVEANATFIAASRNFTPAAAKAVLKLMDAVESIYPPENCPFCSDQAPCSSCYTAAGDSADMNDSDRLEFMEELRRACEGHILTRCFLPSDRTLREQIDELAELNCWKPRRGVGECAGSLAETAGKLDAALLDLISSWPDEE